MKPLTLIFTSVGGIVFLALLFTGYLFFTVRKQSGDRPSGDRQKRIESSPQFNREIGRFQNENPMDFQANMPVFAILKKYIFGSEIRFPTTPLPSTRPDMNAFLSPLATEGQARVLWLGHSCVLLNIDGKIVLLDPTLTQRVSPVYFLGGRFQKPPLELDELPPIDFIVVSHDHYDHLDAGSIRFFARSENQTTKFITTLGVGARLESFGVKSEQIVELDWWESFEAQGFKFTATPAQHFSGRDFSDAAKTLWAGFAIQYGKLNIFFSGDTGYFTHFKAIGEKLGPFDFAILESGQYNLWWHYVHLLPEEVVQAALDVRTKEFLPIHWGMYNLSIHDWFEPIATVSTFAAELGVPIRTPILGETLEIDINDSSKPARPSKWWESHPDFLRRSVESEKSAP